MGGTCSKHDRNVFIHYGRRPVQKRLTELIHTGEDDIKKDLKVMACGFLMD
jgi:hypothetical protein